MKTVFRSRYSWWIVAIMVAMMLILPVVMIFDGFNVAALVFSVIYCAFVLDLMLRTRYTFDGDVLRLRAGVFSATLRVSELRMVERRRSVVNNNSFAWSTDRLILYAPRGYKYEVSPRDEEGFVARLRSLNPHLKMLL